jgi:hypothetical protein
MTDRLRLPSYYQDGMVLQQQVPLHLYGWCAAQASVQIHLERMPYDGRTVSPLDSQYGVIFSEKATADETGVFSLEMPAGHASYDPHILTFSCGEQVIILKDLLFGEIWIAAGQSNMQMPLCAIQPQKDTETLASVHYVRVLCQPDSGQAPRRKRKMTVHQSHTGGSMGPAI